MKSSVWAASLLVVTAAAVLPGSAFCQAPWIPGDRSPTTQTGADQHFRRAVADLDRAGEDVGVLADPRALREYGAASVGSLLGHRNRYIRALALRELREQRDTLHRAEALGLFGGTSLDVGDQPPDPRDGEPLPPDAAVMAAAAEYLASVDKSAFLPTLLGRAETWFAPHWFVPAFRQLGPGWIRASLASGLDPTRRTALGFYIRASATAGNVPELQEALASEDPSIWSGALVACERLDQAGCWDAVEASLETRDTVEVLAARMAQWRRQRTDLAHVFAAAGQAAADAGQVQPGPTLARLWNALDEFVRQAVSTRSPIPPPLVYQLRSLGSPVIERELDGARVK
jgi:hypothetical protein